MEGYRGQDLTFPSKEAFHLRSAATCWEHVHSLRRASKGPEGKKGPLRFFMLDHECYCTCSKILETLVHVLFLEKEKVKLLILNKLKIKDFIYHEDKPVLQNPDRLVNLESHSQVLLTWSRNC